LALVIAMGRELAGALVDLIVSKQTQELITSETGRLPNRAVDVQLEPIVQAASDYINAATGTTGWPGHGPRQ